MIVIENTSSSRDGKEEEDMGGTLLCCYFLVLGQNELPYSSQTTENASIVRPYDLIWPMKRQWNVWATRSLPKV